MHLAGIVGGPLQVSRSLSPTIHNAAFEALGLDWIYATFPVTRDAPAKIERLLKAGVGGLNVTMPHKVQAMSAMEELHPSAISAGCINTVQVRDGSWIGWNTDGPGLVRFLEQDAGFEVAGADAVILGSGGAARGALSGLAAAGAARIRVLARDVTKAREVAALSTLALPGPIEGASLEGVTLLVNATPLGQDGGCPPVDLDSMRAGCVVLDMVYRPPLTPLMEASRRRGADAHSGLGMLLHQACLAFEVWTGLEAPINQMSAAAVAELSRSDA